MEQKQVVNTSDSGVRIFGFIVLLVTFGIFGVWTFLAPIDSATLAPGYVSVKYFSKTVDHLEGGIISELHVQEGSHVDKNQLLIKLDDTQIRAQLEIVYGQFLASKALEARLLSERQKLNNISFTGELNAINDPRLEDAKKTQQEVFRTRRETREGEIAVLKQRIQQLEIKYSGLKQQKNTNEILLESFNEEIKEIEDLLIDGFADKKNLRERQRQYQNLIGSIAEIDADLASTQIQIGETKLQIIQLDKEFEEEVANQLSQLQVEISDMSERITALQDRLTRTAIRAPVSGKVLGLTVHTIGGVIAPGAPILSIVPDGSELTITAEVSPIDIDRVVIGLEAEVRFSSFKRSTTPQLYGRVIHISPDRFINEHSGEAYYQVLVELSQDSVIALQELQLVPGMPADVLISSGERTLFQYLAQPVTDAFVNSFLED